MKKTVFLILSLTILLTTCMALAQNDTNYSFRSDFDAIERVADSIFYVEIIDANDEYIGCASGFVEFKEHLFITNYHVIEKASYLIIWDEDDNYFVLDRYAIIDEDNDLAILEFPNGKKYKSLDYQLNASLKRGQPVTTIGSPQGYQNTVAFGNISAFPKVAGKEMIQFTAPISHGSSGGVLLDDSGMVIGITTAIVSEGENIGFAVPIDALVQLYNRWNKISFETLGKKTNNAYSFFSFQKPTLHPTSTPSPRPTKTSTPKPTNTPKPTQASTDNLYNNLLKNIPVKNISFFGNAEKTGYVAHVGDTIDDLSAAIVITPENATNKELKWTFSSQDKKTNLYLQAFLKNQSITFFQPGIYTLTATTTDGSKLSTSITIYVLPENGVSAYFDDNNSNAQWYTTSDGSLCIRFLVSNYDCGYTVTAFELYIYATDVWGDRIYGGNNVYYWTTETNLRSGNTVYSDYVTIPNKSKISNVYCGIHRVKYSDGTIVTVDDVQYHVWTIK